ncbi:hypothetical protein DL96DRAFT_1620925 [Flagelloscypha sp. PMI_526]|nr:hypothetical protein DL96DRAFT_1620925 [Flagelloscypha sp. PMI_526]
MSLWALAHSFVHILCHIAAYNYAYFCSLIIFLTYIQEGSVQDWSSNAVVSTSPPILLHFRMHDIVVPYTEIPG